RRRSLYRSAPPATYVRTLSLHDALPFSSRVRTNDFKYRPLYESTRTVVDEKDFQILARLARDPFASNEGIGGSLGLSGNSIKRRDRKSTRLNSSHVSISYAVFCLKKKKH